MKNLYINLKINKDIIETVYKSTSNSEKENILSIKLREENENIYRENEFLKKEIEKLRSKVSYYENIFNDSIYAYRESTESLENKIFILQNSIIKKDNLIQSMLDKIKKKNDKDTNDGEREIYVYNIY